MRTLITVSLTIPQLILYLHATRENTMKIIRAMTMIIIGFLSLNSAKLYQHEEDPDQTYQCICACAPLFYYNNIISYCEYI